LSRDWLKRFRDDPPGLRWLDKFRDDPRDPRWLEHLRDDEEAQTERAAARPQDAPVVPRARVASRNIRLFEWLMYLSLVVEALTTASDFDKLAELAGGWKVVVLADFFTIAFFGAFVFVAVYLRKRWALYVLAAFYGFRLLRYIPSFAYIALPLVQFLSAVQFVLQGLALFYAFSGDGLSHFAKPRR
jgi:hypothetical protein